MILQIVADNTVTSLPALSMFVCMVLTLRHQPTRDNQILNNHQQLTDLRLLLLTSVTPSLRRWISHKPLVVMIQR